MSLGELRSIKIRSEKKKGIWTARWDPGRPVLIRPGRINLSPLEQIRNRPACQGSPTPLHRCVVFRCDRGARTRRLRRCAIVFASLRGCVSLALRLVPATVRRSWPRSCRPATPFGPRGACRCDSAVPSRPRQGCGTRATPVPGRSARACAAMHAAMHMARGTRPLPAVVTVVVSTKGESPATTGLPDSVGRDEETPGTGPMIEGKI